MHSLSDIDRTGAFVSTAYELRQSEVIAVNAAKTFELINVKYFTDQNA